MSNPFGGRYDSLAMTGWVAEAPTGRDEAFLMITTDERLGNAGSKARRKRRHAGVQPAPDASEASASCTSRPARSICIQYCVIRPSSTW